MTMLNQIAPAPARQQFDCSFCGTKASSVWLPREGSALYVCPVCAISALAKLFADTINGAELDAGRMPTQAKMNRALRGFQLEALGTTWRASRQLARAASPYSRPPE